MVSNMIVNTKPLSKVAKQTIFAACGAVALIVGVSVVTYTVANRMIDKPAKQVQYYDMGNSVQVLIDKDAEVVCYRVGVSTLFCGKFDEKPVL